MVTKRTRLRRHGRGLSPDNELERTGNLQRLLNDYVDQPWDDTENGDYDPETNEDGDSISGLGNTRTPVTARLDHNGVYYTSQERVHLTHFAHGGGRGSLRHARASVTDLATQSILSVIWLLHPREAMIYYSKMKVMHLEIDSSQVKPAMNILYPGKTNGELWTILFRKGLSFT